MDLGAPADGAADEAAAADAYASRGLYVENNGHAGSLALCPGRLQRKQINGESLCLLFLLAMAPAPCAVPIGAVTLFFGLRRHSFGGMAEEGRTANSHNPR